MDKQLFDEYKPRAAVDFEGCDLKADLLNTVFFFGGGGRGRSPFKSADPEGRGQRRVGQQVTNCKLLVV